jgi:hypothetical protein
MSEFTPPLTARDQEWIKLRERLARAARELHFLAVSIDTGMGAALLSISANLAGLAMSIPMCPVQRAGGGLVDAPTLLAAQILQHDRGPDGEPVVGVQSR